MTAPWMPLALMNASVLTLVPMCFGLGWANLAVAGVAGPPPPHPDASGGSKEAFLAVAGAFEGLSEKLGRRAA